MVDVFLFPVPSDPDSDDVRLRDPTISEGSSDATANGSVIVATASLVSGAASGQQEVAGGYSITRLRRPRPLQVDALAKGGLVRCLASLIPGKARGQRITLLSGVATGDGNAAGVEAAVATFLVSGSAAGERNWSDEEIILIMLEAA